MAFVKKQDLIGKVFEPSYDEGKKTQYGYILGGHLNGEAVTLSLSAKDYEYNINILKKGKQIEAYQNGQYINLREVETTTNSVNTAQPTTTTEASSGIAEPKSIKPALTPFEQQLVDNIKAQFKDFATEALNKQGNLKGWQINKILDSLEL